MRALSIELPLAGDRRDARGPAGGPAEAVRLDPPDRAGGRRPDSPASRRSARSGSTSRGRSRTRANPGDPNEDLTTALIQAEVDGEQLNDFEIAAMFGLLMFAGNDTTRNTISGGTFALIENPDQRQRLLDDPSLVDHRGRGDHPLGDAGDVVPPHRHRTPRSAACRSRRATGRPLVHLGQPRRGGDRDPMTFDVTPADRSTTGLRRRRPALLSRLPARPARAEARVPGAPPATA